MGKTFNKIERIEDYMDMSKLGDLAPEKS